MESDPKNLNPVDRDSRLKKLQQVQMKVNKINGGNKMVASKNRAKKEFHIGVKH